MNLSKTCHGNTQTHLCSVYFREYSAVNLSHTLSPYIWLSDVTYWTEYNGNVRCVATGLLDAQFAWQVLESHFCPQFLGVEDRRIKSFLYAFSELLKATVSRRVCPSVRVERPGSHWTDFHKILFITFRKYVEIIPVSLKSGKNNILYMKTNVCY
jgi:hypothetical protein